MINSTMPIENNSLMENDEEVLGFSAEFDTFPIVVAILIIGTNLFVLYLIARTKSLRTATNVVLGSLAFSDLLTGVLGIPLYLACSALQTPAVCGITQVLIRFSSISIVLHLLLVSIDRYVTVVHAIRYRSLATKQRAMYLLITAWASAIFVALIQLTWIGFDVDVNEDSDFKTQRINTIYDAFCIAFFFAVPLITMIFCYIRIFVVLRQQLCAIEQHNIQSSKMKEEKRSYARKRRAALIFISMIAIYIICWLPYFMLDFQHELGNDFFAISALVEYTLFYYPRFLNSLLNPLLYVFCKHDFRQAIRTFRRSREDRMTSLSLQNTLGKSSLPLSTLALRASRNYEQDAVFTESASCCPGEQPVITNRC